jgi:hypothetical protein
MDLTYEVWVFGKAGPFIESSKASVLVAAFSYFQEALDFRDELAEKRGVFGAVVRALDCKRAYPARVGQIEIESEVA